MKLWDFLRTYISSTCSFLASLCSILSIILMLVSNETYTLIALIVLCLGFIILIYGILRGINKIVLDNSSEDYRRISSFCIFQSHDGVKSTFEFFLMIISNYIIIRTVITICYVPFLFPITTLFGLFLLHILPILHCLPQLYGRE